MSAPNRFAFSVAHLKQFMVLFCLSLVSILGIRHMICPTPASNSLPCTAWAVPSFASRSSHRGIIPPQGLLRSPENLPVPLPVDRRFRRPGHPVRVGFPCLPLGIINWGRLKSTLDPALKFGQRIWAIKVFLGDQSVQHSMAICAHADQVF